MIKTVVGDILDATEEIFVLVGLSSRRHTSDIAEDLKIKMSFLVMFFS